jgi:hypothetical protein
MGPYLLGDNQEARVRLQIIPIVAISWLNGNDRKLWMFLTFSLLRVARSNPGARLKQAAVGLPAGMMSPLFSKLCRCTDALSVLLFPSHSS